MIKDRYIRWFSLVLVLVLSFLGTMSFLTLKEATKQINKNQQKIEEISLIFDTKPRLNTGAGSSDSDSVRLQKTLEQLRIERILVQQASDKVEELSQAQKTEQASVDKAVSINLCVLVLLVLLVITLIILDILSKPAKENIENVIEEYTPPKKKDNPEKYTHDIHISEKSETNKIEENENDEYIIDIPPLSASAAHEKAGKDKHNRFSQTQEFEIVTPIIEDEDTRLSQLTLNLQTALISPNETDKINALQNFAEEVIADKIIISIAKKNPLLAKSYQYQGISYSNQKKYKEAIDCFTKVLNIYPNYTNALVNRGIAYAKLDEHENAIKDYDKVISLRKDNPKGYLNRAFSLLETGRYQEAIADFEASQNLIPTDLAFYGKGLALAALKQNEKATVEFSKAITMNPSDLKFYLQRAKALLIINKTDEALNDLDHILEHEANNADAYALRAKTFTMIGKDKQALEDIGKAISISPNNKEYIYQKALLFIKHKKYKEAIFDLTEIINMQPEDEEAYYNRGIAYAQINNWKKAITDFTKVIELNKNNYLAYYFRGASFVELNHFEEAIADLTFYINSEKDRKLIKEAYISRAHCYTEARLHAKALEDINTALSFGECAVSYNERGYTFYKMHQYEKAIQDLNMAINIDPTLQEAYFNRANVYEDIQEYAIAINNYSAAIQLDDKYFEAYYNRGLVFNLLGSKSNAIADFNKCIEIDPENLYGVKSRAQIQLDKALKGAA